MNAITPLSDVTTPEPSVPAEFTDSFERQRGAFLAHPCPSYAERIADLRAMHRLLVENRAALVEAVHRDYGNRSRFETLFTECLLNQEGILDAIKHLRRWMKPQKRRLDITQYPFASARVIPQPVGVVGVVAPWNFPISMAFAPLTGIVAAGNRAMVKMSENSSHLARLLMEISPATCPRTNSGSSTTAADADPRSRPCHSITSSSRGRRRRARP